ncbi:MAG: ATP-binding cassette domain-containing protein [Planctomycetes bacterium]|nr:ATP-binding cassette domain-containing protein [Planctomycetota bacterium]
MQPAPQDGVKIRVRGLTIGYGGVPILRDLDFDVHSRGIFVILGGSGCGKSTLLRHLTGLQTPIAGSIEIAGVTRFPPPVDEPPPFGVSFQTGALFGSRTLLENVALPLQKWTGLPAPDIDNVAFARLRLVGLGGFENHLPAEISGGMRKRASIARALALEPDLLFLDEPSAGLDPITSVELDDLLTTLNRSLGVTIVLVTHELESIFRIGTDCIMLDRDALGIIARGDPRELRTDSSDPRVHRFFNRLPAGA